MNSVNFSTDLALLELGDTKFLLSDSGVFYVPKLLSKL